MPDPLPPLHGGCLCGARALRSHARPPRRLLLPLPHVPAGLRQHARRLLQPAQERGALAERPPAYYASSKIARRGFCGRCGTPLSFEFLDSERMDLSVGSLDEPGLLKPTEHFAVESRIDSWFHDDGLPRSRIDENARIQQRWREAYGADVQPGLQAVRERGTMSGSTATEDPTHEPAAHHAARRQPATLDRLLHPGAGHAAAAHHAAARAEIRPGLRRLRQQPGACRDRADLQLRRRQATSSAAPSATWPSACPMSPPPARRCAPRPRRWAARSRARPAR